MVLPCNIFHYFLFTFYNMKIVCLFFVQQSRFFLGVEIAGDYAKTHICLIFASFNSFGLMNLR
jgi:hypothetical protein